jgi:hypothetical protein
MKEFVDALFGYDAGAACSSFGSWSSVISVVGICGNIGGKHTT